jgi:capsular polysaccharide transport system permease protein
MRILEKILPHHKNKWFLPALIVGLPMALAVLYYAVIAAPRYQAESKVLIKDTAEQKDKGSSALGALLANAGSAGDALYLKEYILSLDMLQRLDRTLNLRSVFSETRGLDFASRLPRSAPQEWFLAYYRSHVDVLYDDKSTLLTIRTIGFTPDFAVRLNQAILAESERFINETSHRIAREQMDFAGQEVTDDRRRLDTAQQNLIDYQNRNGVFDPIADAQAASKMIADTEAKASELEADIRNMRTYLNDDTPQVVAAKNALRSLREQIDLEKAKIAAPGTGKLNRLAAKFLDVKSAVDFNSDLYRTALTAYETTRVEAARKIKSVAVIASPHPPEESEWPQTLLNLATLLVITTLLYGLVRLVGAVIEDHRD